MLSNAYSFFNKKVDHASDDHIHQSQEFDRLKGYLDQKSDSFYFGYNESKWNQIAGTGISTRDVNHYSIAKWLNQKLNQTLTKENIIAIIWSAAQTVLDEVASEFNSHSNSLDRIIRAYQQSVERCEEHLKKYKNEEMVELALQNDISIHINNLYKSIIENQEETLPIQNKPLIHFQYALANSFDLGTSGTGITRLNIIKFTIANWLVNHTYKLTWSNINLSAILITAAEVNTFVEVNKNDNNSSTVNLDIITQLYTDYTNLCQKQFDECKNHKKFCNDNISLDADDECSDFVIVSSYQRPCIIASNLFCKSELSRIITLLYDEMEKVQKNDKNNQSGVELRSYEI